MRKLSKIVAGTVAASLLTLSVATPAEAQRRHRHDHDDIDAGDVIAGIAIIGGIAAVASALSNRDRYRYRDRYGYDSRYYGYGDRDGYDRGGYGYGEGAAVNSCVYEAQRYGGRVSITDVDRRSGRSYRVYGVIDGYGGGGGYYDYGDRGYGYDRYGYGRYGDRTGFRCTARDDGRVTGFAFDRSRY